MLFVAFWNLERMNIWLSKSTILRSAPTPMISASPYQVASLMSASSVLKISRIPCPSEQPTAMKAELCTTDLPQLLSSFF